MVLAQGSGPVKSSSFSQAAEGGRMRLDLSSGPALPTLTRLLLSLPPPTLMGSDFAEIAAGSEHGKMHLGLSSGSSSPSLAWSLPSLPALVSDCTVTGVVSEEGRGRLGLSLGPDAPFLKWLLPPSCTFPQAVQEVSL